MANTVKTSAELVDRAKKLIRGDVKKNDDLSGINFSSFLGDVLNEIIRALFKVSTEMMQLDYGHTSNIPRVTDSAIIQKMFNDVIFKFAKTIKHLKQTDSFKDLDFTDTQNAIVIIGLIHCRDVATELKRLESFIEDLVVNRENHEENEKASTFFLELP